MIRQKGSESFEQTDTHGKPSQNAVGVLHLSLKVDISNNTFHLGCPSLTHLLSAGKISPPLNPDTQLYLVPRRLLSHWL